MAREPDDEVFTIRALEQLKVLADPLRLRILESLCEERTTKQVAEQLGEPPTKLYHHVLTLEKAGLIRRTRTRRNRGTLEKYYVAVARSFRTDPQIFRGGEPPAERAAAAGELIEGLMRSTAEELRQVLSSDRFGGLGDPDDPRGLLEEKGIVSFLEVRADQGRIDEYKRMLESFLRELEIDTPSDAKTGPERRYRFTLAWFPLDSDKF